MRHITDAEVLEAIERLGWGELLERRDDEGGGADSTPDRACDTFRDGKTLIGRDLGAKPPSSTATSAGFSIETDMVLKEPPGGK